MSVTNTTPPEKLTPDVKVLIMQHHQELLDTVKDQVANLNGKYETTVQDKVDKINARLDSFELTYLRPVLKAANTETDEEVMQKAQRETYHTYLRKGEGQIAPDKIKLLTESDGTTGGFFVIPEYEQSITKSVILISPIRQYTRVRTTGSDTVKLPKRTGTFAAVWTAEAGLQTEATGLKYGIDNVPNHEMTAFQDISNIDLEDSMFDMAGEINSEFAEQFAKAEGAAFVNGTANGQPEGFMSNTTTAVDVTGSATLLTYLGFVNCAHNLKSVYAANATWFLNRQSIGAVRQIVDLQNRPIWLPWAQAGLSGANAPTILGLPYAEIPDMAPVATGNYAVALGDWKKAYIIVDRIGIAVMRDPYIQAVRSAVRFYARKRVGGQLILSEAMRRLQVHA